MAITAQSVSTGSSSSDSVTISKPSGLTEDDLMVVVIAAEGGAVSGKTGWTSVTDGNIGSKTYHRVLKKIADSTDVAASDFTFNSSSANAMRGTLYRIDGHSVDLAPDVSINDTDTNFTGSMSITASMTPRIPDNLLIFAAFTADASDEAIGFSGYSISGGTNPTWTEQHDQDMGSGASYAVANATYGTDDEITGASVSVDQIDQISSGRIIAMAFPPQQDVAGTSTLLENSNEAAFSPSGRADTNATATLVENQNAAVFSPAQAKGEQPTIYANQTKSSTTFANQSKSSATWSNESKSSGNWTNQDKS